MIGYEERYLDLRDFVQRKGLRKSYVADLLGVKPWQLSWLLNPKRYPNRKVDDDLIPKIAALLNQPEQYVRALYGRTAA